MLTSESTPSHGLRPFPNPKLPGLHPPSPASLPPPNTTLYTDYSRLPSQGSPGLPRSLAKLESTRNRRGLRRSGPPAKSPPHPSLQGGRGSQRQRGQRWLARKRTCSLTWTLGLDRSRGLAGVAASTHPRPETPSPEAGRGEGQRLLIGPARPAARGPQSRGVVAGAPAARGGAVPLTWEPRVWGLGEHLSAREGICASSSLYRSLPISRQC